ncbi:MAG: ATP-binding protein [Nitrospirae bacterium]|nr:ATP-binding protein [Nitrospirota bacterium]
MELRNKVGVWVDGDDFWDRDHEIERLTELIDGGENILVVAPRRVGKTSLLREMIRRLRTRDRDILLFVDVEDCSSPEDVIVALSMATQPYKNLWKLTLDVFKTVVEGIRDKVDEVSIDVVKLKIREGTAEAWQVKGERLFAALAEAEKPVVACFDELPIMVDRLLRGGAQDATTDGIQKAGVFLSWLRKMCQEHKGHVRVVLCGSIGLEPVLHRVKLSHTIGHLRSFDLPVWSREVADGCLEALARSYGLAIPQGVREAMLNRLGWLVPHHVQMYFGHVHDDCERRGSKTATVRDVERVYTEQMLGTRGHAELADYEERLLRVLGSAHVPLAPDLLTEAAVNGVVDGAMAQALARRALPKGANPGEELGNVLRVLEHDGYLRFDEKKNGHVFQSLLLRDWWERRFKQGHVPPSGSDR